MLHTAVLLSIFWNVLIYLFIYKVIYNYWKKRNVPFPKPYFPFGNIWKVITLRQTMGSFIRELYDTYKNHPYIGLFIMFKPALLMRNTKFIKDILIKDFEHFQDNWYTVYPSVDFLLACNPFVQRGKTWRESRGILTSQFTGAKIKSCFPSIEKNCTSMVDYLNRKMKTKPSDGIELADLSARFTGENVMSWGFGLEAQSFTNEIPETFTMVKPESDNVTGFVISMKRTFGLISQLAQRIFKLTFVGNPTPTLFYDVIANTANKRLENNIVRNDFLSNLIDLRAKNVIDTKLLAGHAYTLFLDGFQTSFAAMAYAIFELAINTNVQDLAREHVLTVLEKHDGRLSYEAVQDLQYVENVLYETLRKHPIIRFMTRMCTKQYDLKDSNESTCLTIEKGTYVYISTKGIHNDPEYYPDPDVFDPDRFKEEAIQARPKCTFLGFGEGQRICIGRRFAIAQIVAGLAAILLNFELKLNGKTKFPIKEEYFHLSDVPVSGLYVDFVKRPLKN